MIKTVRIRDRKSHWWALWYEHHWRLMRLYREDGSVWRTGPLPGVWIRV